MDFVDLNPSRFMAAGDIHGDTQHAIKLFKWCRRYGVKVVVPVGDFGFVWPNTRRVRGKIVREGYPQGKTRLDQLSRLAVEHGIDVCWLDGNHEDFDRLEELGAFPHKDHPVTIAENIHYLPRGSRWTWGGVKFMAIGGAYSVDEHRRIRFIDWWPQETLKSVDLYRIEADAEDHGPVDVVLSHDVPQLPPELDEYLRPLPILGMDRSTGRGYKLDNASKSNRVALAQACSMVNPKMIIHGHYHHPYYGHWVSDSGTRATVVGLGKNGDGVNSYIIFDAEAFKQDNTDHGRNL